MGSDGLGVGGPRISSVPASPAPALGPGICFVDLGLVDYLEKQPSWQAAPGVPCCPWVPRGRGGYCWSRHPHHTQMEPTRGLTCCWSPQPWERPCSPSLRHAFPVLSPYLEPPSFPLVLQILPYF